MKLRRLISPSARVTLLTILILCLSLHTTEVFTQSNAQLKKENEQLKKENEQLKKEKGELEEENEELGSRLDKVEKMLDKVNTDVEKLKGKTSGDDPKEQGKKNIVKRVVSKVPILRDVVETGKDVIDIYTTKCAGYCKERGYAPEYHFRRCKAGHPYWVCELPNMAWLHRACCPPGHTFREDSTGVWRCMPNNTGSGSGSQTNPDSSDPQDQ